MRSRYLLVCALLALTSAPALAQRSLTADGVIEEDFSAYRGTGLDPGGTDGRLDSDEWRFDGGSAESTSDFGDTVVYTMPAAAPAGVLGQRTDPGSRTSGGVYAYVVGTDDFALGIKPTGPLFTPGTIHFRFTNGTGAPITSLDVSFDFLVFNNQPRGQAFVAELRVGDDSAEIFSTVTPAEADPAPVTWTRQTVRATLDLDATPIADGATVELVWSTDDATGSGSRDALAIDNLVIATTRCGNGIISEGDVCDDGNTVTETACPYGEATCTLCNADCSMELELMGGVCGDGTVDTPDEQCDEGDTPRTACDYGTMTCTGCNTDCEEIELMGPYCGDSIVQEAEGEECDPPGETCSATCQTIAPGEDGGVGDAGVDGGPMDGGVEEDAGVDEDASVPADASVPPDAAITTDASTPADGGVGVDAGGTEEDSGGCGCSTPGRSGLPSLLVLGLFVGMALRRRR
ncbi:MAG: hypothetical protein KF901_12215 [Myxococcales bacterium]|nr:hypothetical protein [Myxococcales bacterium]